MKRQHNDKHLDFVRSLPCVICGDDTSTEAAHIRYPAIYAGKRATGMGEKPDDCWTVPMCGEHHRLQHKGNEIAFWTSMEISPVFVALALWRASGNRELGEQIVAAHRAGL